ncbi:NAD-glutamate dehydrogenase domain-containing protein [Desulfuromonas acetexigens]|uniref:NAD-glutamate dehydrogenase n=1 Tax=Trichloromonas acetexigens TaxID=38815 RepID=A0A550JH53_9BACT|nr:NAD-glutamate dehydrogenase domain-containing protein [Desulfuromonas acetexigens]TRO82528.1 NAD-glutamate dehydrogenase [Desulfuromonas acetexigens]
MTVFADTYSDSSSRAELDDLFARVETLLSAASDDRRRSLALDLGQLFRQSIHPTYLLSLSPETLAHWLSQLVDCLESRGTGVGVFLINLEGGHPLLVCSSPDAPFLVDSLLVQLKSREIPFHLICHPSFPALREKNQLLRLGAQAEDAPRESLILAELAVLPEIAAELVPPIHQALSAALAVEHARDDLEQRLAATRSVAEAGGHDDFWQWLADGNFLPFAYRRRRVVKADATAWTFELQEEGLLGISLPAEAGAGMRRRLETGEPVAVETTAVASPLLRAEKLVAIGCLETSAGGLCEVHEFFGLFSEKVRGEPAWKIPALRRRIEEALNLSGLSRGSHGYRNAVKIFNAFPKVELFFLDAKDLAAAVRSVAAMSRDTLVRIIAAASPALSGLTLFLILPRGSFSVETMARVERYLRRFFSAPAAEISLVQVTSEHSLHHAHLLPRHEPVHFDPAMLERCLSRMLRPWTGRLRRLLEKAHGEAEGRRLWREFGESFDEAYRNRVHPRFAQRDVLHLDRVARDGGESFDLWGPFAGVERYYRLQFYSSKRSYLNDLMPILQNLGLSVIEEVDFDLPGPTGLLHIKSFALFSVHGELADRREALLEALSALRRGELENDYLNQLLIPTGLSWKEIDIFRAYRNYFFQLGTPFSKKRVAYALINNAAVALLLYRYFEGRFKEDAAWQDFSVREEQVLSPLRQEIVDALREVSDVNEDQILRTLFNLIDSTVRSNFFVRRNSDDYLLSFKINALGIIDMPAPRPMFEIYVHSAAMEGIHLRGGRVARGGIRWSDRPDDFRTEVLGLMKTQMAKNALIVPVGSKGGFVVKTPYRDREEGMALAKAAYQTLIRGLLDLTDNRVGDQIVRPEGIVAYDAEDPYLVVAADKGTAHLPDTANELSQGYGFWLDDAFASGGSRGYSHKALGITARGAWESVKRHFRELGQDTQSEPFTVVGIGDMSGDVFGNGMLLSRHIRLQAAFDHRHIFLDPDPDPEPSFGERRRLFQLPRSSWDDYDRALISPGGGVYPRAAKEIPLSPEVRAWLGVRHETIDPDGLIRLLLTAEVDLLWNGGIGTYVKANSEKNEEVGDRTNDKVRVDGRQLRARVVGEGGNLGFTQRGRIEYALAGGRINTDAVDNSGGVDCSDHEVNLKIFMQHLLGQGVIAGQDARDALLRELTDEVCDAVLADNYGQSLCLSLDQRRCLREVEPHLEHCERLARAGLMDRRGEYLPSEKELLARDPRVFTRPELAILMAYGKMQIYQYLLEADLVASPDVRALYLPSYFPKVLHDRYGEHLFDHPLAAEITATAITNYLVDRGGSSLINSLCDRHGLSQVVVTASWLGFDRVIDGETLRQAVHALDNRMPADRQLELLLSLEDTLVAFCDWALAHDLELAPHSSRVASLREQLAAFEKVLGGLLPEEEWQRCKNVAQAVEEQGMSAELARRFSLLGALRDFLPVVMLNEEAGGELYATARAFLDLRRLLGLDELARLARTVPLRDQWDRQALRAVTSAFERVGFRLARLVLEEYSGNPEACLAARRRELNGFQRLRESLRGMTLVNYHPLLIVAEAAEDLLP